MSFVKSFYCFRSDGIVDAPTYESICGVGGHSFSRQITELISWCKSLYLTIDNEAFDFLDIQLPCDDHAQNRGKIRSFLSMGASPGFWGLWGSNHEHWILKIDVSEKPRSMILRYFKYYAAVLAGKWTPPGGGVGPMRTKKCINNFRSTFRGRVVYFAELTSRPILTS